MKNKTRRWLIGLSSAALTLGLFGGVFASLPTAVEQAAASGSAPTVSMVSGASARLVPGEPGIRFTARIDNYSKDYQYGMLILPAAAWDSCGWDNDTDYLAYLNEMGITMYAHEDSCTVYKEGEEYRISFALRNLYTDNYTQEFVGVAYTEKNGVYDYADVDLITNARSVAYVAQQALKYEEGLTSESVNALETYKNAGAIIDGENGENTAGEKTEVKESNYVARFDVDYIVDDQSNATKNSFITKKAYASGTTFSFKYLIPQDSVTGGWWSVCWTKDPSVLDIYAHVNANGDGKALSTSKGTWLSESITLPSGGPYYIYFAGAKGEWGKYGAEGEGYVYIDDFTVGGETENFSANTSDWLLEVNTPAAVRAYEYEKGSLTFGNSSGVVADEYAAKIIVDKINSAVGMASFITKEKYVAGSEVSFKYYVPNDVTASWFAVCGVTDTNSTDIYSNWLWQGSIIKGSWQTMTVTLTQDSYIHFAGAVGDWGGKDSPKTEGYILIDDFTVTKNGEVVAKDDFNKGVAENLFDCNTEGAVVEGEGYVVVDDPTDYMLTFNAEAIGGNEYIAMITDNAYAGVSEITFKAKWTGLATSSRWGLSYTTDPSTFSYEAVVSAINCYTPKLGNLKQDAGVVYIYKYTFSGGAYTLSYSADDGESFESLASGNYTEGSNYFYFMVCPAVSGEGAAFHLDDFSITYAGETAVDSFKNQTSALFVESATKNSHHGSVGMNIVGSTLAGGEETPEVPELGEIAMKYICNVSGEIVSQVTKQAFPGGSTVSFKYYIPAGTSAQWWGLVWSTSNSGLDIYAAADGSKAYNPSKVTGEWLDASFTLPAGGPYYLYFGSEVGHWLNNGENAEIYIDEFKVENGEEVIVHETFNGGVANSIFQVLVADAVVDSAIGEGWAPINGAYGAKLTIDLISSTATTPSFITAQKYTGGVTVSFDYYMSGNTNNKWWTLNWTTDNKVASIYAFVENNPNQQGYQLPNVQDSWQTVSVDIPEGEWYFYFGGAVNEWSGGYVIIDNFKIGDTVTETFNDGTYGIFLDNRDSKPDAITIADGKTEFIPGDYSAKLDFTNSFGNNAKTFMTKAAIASGGSIVTFKFLIPNDTTVGDWWSFNWTTDPNYSENFWGVGNGAASGCGGVNPNPNKYKGQGWVTFTYTLPNDDNMYYLYFCGYSNWNGCVYIDDFQVISSTGIYFDDFTNGNEGLFNAASSDVSYSADYNSVVELGEAKDYAAKISVDKLTGAQLAEFITKQSYPAGSVVTFDYYIPNDVTFKTSGTWWTLCVTSNPLASDVYSNHWATLPKEQGSWKTVSYTLDKDGYIYFAGAIGEWNGGCVYIDNFTVTSGDVTVTDDFSYGVENGLFMVNTPAAITAEKVVVKVSDDPYAHVNLLANDTILDVMNNGGYAYIQVVDYSRYNANIPLSMIMMEGSFEFTYSGIEDAANGKEFAIYFGGDYYLLVTGEEISLYSNKTLVKKIAFAANFTHKLSVVVTAWGENIYGDEVSSKLSVKIDGGEYVGMGEIGQPTQIKFVALGGEGKLALTDVDFDKYVAAVMDIPIYFSAERIDFTAYAFDSDEMISEEGFQLLAEAGFTKTLALLQGRLPSGDLHEQDIPDRAHVENLMAEVNKDAIAALLLAEKYGMKHYALNSNLYNIERNPNNYQWLDDFAELSYEEYSKVLIDGVTKDLSKAFAGFFLADEPQSGKLFTENELEELVDAYKAFKQAFPNSEAFINLLPREATQFTLGESSYEDYVDYYIENIALDKDGVKGTGYVSFDHYPLEDSGITSEHLRNLELIAEKCRDNNLELRTYIKASTSGDSERGKRATESVNDLYAQIYSALAFGSKEIIYYQFTDHKTTNGAAGDGVISGDSLEKGNVYNWTKQANNEVLAFSNAYMNFKWKSVSIFGKTNVTQFNNLKSEVSAYGALKAVSAVQGTPSILVGNFDAIGEYTYGAAYAYMVVNYGDPQDAVAASEIKLTFDSATYSRVLVYKKGEVRVLNLSLDGEVTLSNVEVGEGMFVIPLTNDK